VKEGAGDHGHERVPMQALPGPPFEAIEAGLFLHQLMPLLTNPARLDGSGAMNRMKSMLTRSGSGLQPRFTQGRR
jgi:hypothetical protein